MKDSLSLVINDKIIKPGTRTQLELHVAKLFDYTEMTIPVKVICGREPGPILFVSAAVHGDEINGVEAIKRLLASKAIHGLKGTLIAVPIVNVFGFNNLSRYLPDRRDLNRCFPGSARGSMAAQMANTFMEEIVRKCTHGIDLHTGAIHRTNLPQIRACLDNETTYQMAHAFGAPVILDTKVPEGSLREAVEKEDIPVLLFEGGEALRYNEQSIRAAHHGILSVMHKIGMIPAPSFHNKEKEVFIAHNSRWIRAPHSGSLKARVHLGAKVTKGQTVGYISDPFGKNKHKMKSPVEGLVIGMTMLPLLNRGDAAFHIASFKDMDAVEDSIEAFQENLLD